MQLKIYQENAIEELLEKAKSNGQESGSCGESNELASKQKNKEKIISIKNLFSATTKFQKHMRR